MVSTPRRGEGTRFFLSGTLLVLLILVNVAPNASAQGAGYSPDSLFIALFSNGDALVEYDVKILNPLAEDTRIRLFGQGSITNLIVVDYDDNVIDFTPGTTPNEIVLKTPAVSNARISYSTQDLVDKTQGRWTFSLNDSSISFAVKLPPDSVLIDPGENFPTIKPVGNQQLLTFKPGNVRFVYVIGVLGTEEQAGIVIRLAETTISEATGKHSDIILTLAKDLLQKATQAKDEGRFSDAESLAGQSNDAAEAAVRDYEAAQTSISDAEDRIREATGQGRETAKASEQLQAAQANFASGNYTMAKDTAEGAVASIGSVPDQPQMPIFVIVLAVVAAGGGVGAMLFLRSRKPALASIPTPAERSAPQEQPIVQDPSPGPPEQVPEAPTPVLDIQPQVERAVEAPATIPDSQNDKSMLARIVGKILEERPHLRPEDQDVLRYLAEKEGAAFESEIRSRFQLPKTTIWRLVKRLEREELVEIRKAGGQNLIKLRFENRGL